MRRLFRVSPGHRRRSKALSPAGRVHQRGAAANRSRPGGAHRLRHRWLWRMGGTPGRLKTATPRSDRLGAHIQAETSSSSFWRPAHLKGGTDHGSSIPTVDGATMSLTSRSLRLTAMARPPSAVLLRTRLVLPGTPTSSGSLKERRGVPRAGQIAFSHCDRSVSPGASSTASFLLATACAAR